MNRIALLVALGAGLGGAILLETYKARFEEEKSGGDPVSVLYLNQDLPLGKAITQEMLGVRDLPEAYVEDRHIRESDARKVIGVRANQALQANESLFWTDLATGSARRNLSMVIQNGKRAITVRGDEGTLTSLLKPGDRVDLLMTANRGTETVTFPLLQNLLVLAVGTDLGHGDEDVGMSSYALRGSVTLSVTLAEAQLVSIATQSGTLTPVLRNPADIVVAEDFPETTKADVLAAEKVAEAQDRRKVVPHVDGKEIERVQ
jgi:pilus assembly protein CpaB